MMKTRANNTQEQLSEIVRLKKRAAENAYQTATQNLRVLDEQIARTQTSIDVAGTDQGAFSGAELSTAVKFVQRQAADLKHLTAQRGPLLQAVEEARHKLKNIIVSETVLNQEP